MQGTSNQTILYLTGTLIQLVQLSNSAKISGRRGRSLADVSGNIFASPVVPVVDTVPEDVLVLEIGHAVLGVPVVRLAIHPVVPLYFCAGMVPCPVTPVVVIVVPVHSSSYPPLIVVLVSWDAPVSLAHSIRDEFSHEPVLLTPMSLVHVDQPPTVGSADGGSVGLRHSFVESTEKNTLYLISNIADMPPIRAVVGVLSVGKT